MLTIEQSKKLKTDHKDLIGKISQGGQIEALIITPRNDPEFSKGLKYYLRTQDSESVLPANNESGYTVTVVSRIQQLKNNVYHEEIFATLKFLEIEIDLSEYGVSY
ncbi:MAG: hypothetical protein IPM82_27535 [Saprospiraceae bacterium]|nr:hypothetical protein [Saprospiraceae bacterium]